MLIYALIDPITNDVMYVGKTKCLRNRYRAHVSLSINARYKGVKGDWIRYLAFHNDKPIVAILNDVPDRTQQEWEHFYIKLFKCCPLVNTATVYKETLQITIPYGVCR